MRSRCIRPYIPLCNHHIRFYFSNQERTKFRNNVERKQFLAANKILGELSPKEFETIREIITPPGKDFLDIDNSYVNSNIRMYCFRTNESQGSVYRLFNRVTKQLAIELEYTADIGGDAR